MPQKMPIGTAIKKLEYFQIRCCAAVGLLFLSAWLYWVLWLNTSHYLPLAIGFSIGTTLAIPISMQLFYFKQQQLSRRAHAFIQPNWRHR